MENLKRGFEKSIEELNLLLRDPDYFISEFYDKVIRQNDLRREEFIKTINEASLDEHDKLVKMRNTCYNNVVNIREATLALKKHEKESCLIVKETDMSEFGLKALINETDNLIFGYKKKLLDNSVFIFANLHNEPLTRHEFRIEKASRSFFWFELDLNDFSKLVKSSSEDFSDNGELESNFLVKSSKVLWNDEFFLSLTVNIKQINEKASLGIWLNCDAKNEYR